MKKDTLQKLAHLGAGLITLVHGFEAFEKGELGPAAGYFIFAIAFLVVAGAHKTLLRKFMQGDMAFFLLEALIILYSGWHYKAKGQNVLYYIMAIIGGLYIVFAILNFIFRDTPRKHRSKGKSRRKHKHRTITTEEFLKSGGIHPTGET